MIEQLKKYFSNKNINYIENGKEFIFSPLTVNSSQEFQLFKGCVAKPSTKFTAEGFQMLSYYQGTFENPYCISRCPDNKEPYNITKDDNYFTVYNYIAFFENQKWTLLGFSSCEKFQGFFKLFKDGTIEVLLDLENQTENIILEKLVCIENESLYKAKIEFSAYINQNHPKLKVNFKPTGWCSWYSYYADVNEEKILNNLDKMKNINELEYLLIDDGYQTHMGDWLSFSKDKFSSGLENIVNKIRSYKKKPAIWIAPFICSNESQIFQKHPDWLIQNKSGEPLCSESLTYSGWREAPWYMLDYSNKEVQKYMFDVISYFYNKLGITYFKLDSLYWGAIKGTQYKTNITRIENYRICLKIFQQATNNNGYILGCNAPLWPSLGLVHGMRCGDDVERNIQRYKDNFNILLNRLWMSPNIWHVDPDCLCIKDLPNQTTSQQNYQFHFNGMQLFSDVIMLGDPLDQYNLDDLQKIKQLINESKNRILLNQSDDLIEITYQENNNNYRIKFDFLKIECSISKV